MAEKQPDPGPYKAEKCPCGHRICQNWFVSPVAAVQGVSFTQKQAIEVAAFLNAHKEQF